jgi:hypothetical protein
MSLNHDDPRGAEINAVSHSRTATRLTLREQSATTMANKSLPMNGDSAAQRARHRSK